MHHVPRLLTYVVLLVVSTSCKDESNSEDVFSYDPQGTWRVSCIEVVIEDISERLTREFVFEGSSFEEHVDVFSIDDEDCSNKVESQSIAGKFELGKIPEAGARTIDFTYEDVSVVLADQDTVDFHNSNDNTIGAPVCGGAWVSGVSKTLSAAACAQNPGSLPYAPLTVFDIFQIRNDKISFGLKVEEIPSAKEDRPSSLDTAQEIPATDGDDPIAAVN